MSDIDVSEDKINERKEKLKYHKLIIAYEDLLKRISNRFLVKEKISMNDEFKDLTGFYLIWTLTNGRSYLFSSELFENAVCDHYDKMEEILEKYKKIIDN